MAKQSKGARRPVASRNHEVIHALTTRILQTSITPDQISLASIGFAALGALALFCAPYAPWLFLVGVFGAQMRLLCNLLDGLIAVEGRRGTKIGVLYNEIPDRISDTLLIVGLGYSAGLGWLGWAGAVLAAITAYIRTLGGALGFEQDFRGPLAKPQRMALLSLVCILAFGESLFRDALAVPTLGVAALALGALATCVTRTLALAKQLEADA